MGLFVAEDGHFQGWLAAFLCCFAAVNEDEGPNEKRRLQATDRLNACNEQPQRLMTPISFTSVLTLNAFKGDEPMIHGTRRTYQSSDKPPFLLPLDLGEYPLMGPFSSQSNPRGLLSQDQSTSSAPFLFRRLDHTDTQRQPLIPLRLGPVVLREPPDANVNAPAQPKPSLTHDSECSGSIKEQFTEQDERPRSYRINHESPFQRCQNQGLPFAQTPPGAHADAGPRTVDIEQPTPTRPPSSTRSSSSSVRRHAVDTPASSVKSRTSSERVRPKRKRSFGLARRDGGEQLEQEILELNTIVEERRAENARDNSQYQHVPAVAPSMQIRARSETLDAIGSALSRPLPVQSPQLDADPFSSSTPKQTSTQHYSSDNSWRRSRLSGWLFGILPSSPPTHLATGEPFYKCQPPPQQRRKLSELSGRTSLSEFNSASMTVTSSPASRGHRRNLTDESRTTPLSPILHSRTISKTDMEDHWPTATRSTTEVGLAL